MEKIDKPKVCLLIHGFTGGPYEIQPLAEYLKKQGWYTVTPTLPGHRDDLKGLGTVTQEDWVAAMESAAKQTTEAAQGEFDLVGFSMGGLLAAYLANRFPVRRLILLNSAVYYVSPVRFFKYSWERINERRFDDFSRLKKVPLSSTMEFIKTVRKLKSEYKKLEVPTLIIQGRQDPIIHPYSGGYIASQIKTKKELVFFPKSKHLICWEEDSHLLFGKVHQFLDL